MIRAILYGITKRRVATNKMKKKKFYIIGIASLTLIGGTFAFADGKSSDSDSQNETVTISKMDSDAEKLVQSEVPFETVEDETHLLDEIKNANLSEIEEKEDSVLIDHSSNVPEVNAEYYNTSTQEEIFTSQSPNELGNAEEYQSVILNEWFAGDETSVIEATTVNGHAAVVRHSDVGANALYVITDENVYTFSDASYDTLRELAEQLNFK